MRLQESDEDDSTGAAAGGDTPPHADADIPGGSRGDLMSCAYDEDADLAAAIAASLADQRPKDGAAGGSVPTLSEEPEAGTG